MELTAPDGRSVKLPTRSTGLLLSGLADAGPRGLSRRVLEEALWPGAAERSQKANLRQTLTRLRRVIGCESLEIDRTTCRLRAGFRVQVELPAKTQTSETDPILALLHLSKWLASHSPTRAVQLMRENYDLIPGMHADDLSSLLGSIIPQLDPRGREAGWCALWQGFSLSDTSIASGWRAFYRALQIARERNDLLLELEASFWLGSPAITSGRLHVAKRIVDRCEELESVLSPPRHLLRTAWLRGALQYHLGNPVEGAASLERYPIDGERALEQARLCTLRAFFHATTGQADSAWPLLEQAECLALGCSHVWINDVSPLTKAILAFEGGNIAEADRHLSVVEECAGTPGARQVRIYATELRAHVCDTVGDPEEAERQRWIARRERASVGMGYTPWDNMRLRKAPSSGRRATDNLPGPVL